jgi:uncharacterized phage protein (TIGR02218 family)
VKTIPTALQTHLDTGQTTLCFLLKVAPQNATAFGVTSLDQDVAYDDGNGSLTYSSMTGMNATAVESSSELSVDNSEAMLLVSTDFTKEDIAAGVLDFADFYVYRINWANTSDGHYLVHSGTTGIVRSHNDLSGVIELRGLSQVLKQNYIDQYSLTCRAKFGSQEGEESFPCGFDTTSLWQSTSVSAVDTESDRIFTSTDTPAATGPNGALTFETALVTFLTGNNAGLTAEVDDVTGDVVTLRFNAAYEIEVGDTFKIRPDCRKRFAEDCVALFDNGLNFRGEPWIPLTEEAPSQFPGALIKGLGAPLA